MKRCCGKGPGCEDCTRPVCRVELSGELSASLSAGEMTERFAEMAMKVCEGFFTRRSWGGLAASLREDYQSRFVDRLMKDWVKADPEQNVFAFLSGMANFSRLDVDRKIQARERNIQKLRAKGLLVEDPQHPTV